MNTPAPPGREFPRPRVVVSKCLGFDACRYNGQILPNRFLEALSRHAELVTVCPEVEIGLGVPRDPIHRVRDGSRDTLVQPRSGRDLTEPMIAFRERFLDTLPAVDGFVLKSRSPSCAVTDAKFHAPRPDAPTVGRGPGLFTEGVLARHPDAAVEDEGRLTNFRIREHFLTRIYATAELRRVRETGRMAELVRFQARMKLVLMALSQVKMRALGRLVANPDRRPFAAVVRDYEKGLRAAFSRLARHTAHVNVLMHAIGYFKEGLTAREKGHFLDLLTRYREGRLPLSAPVAVLRSTITRFEEDYLAGQFYFEPFPEELVEITDSGKGRGT